MSKQHIDWKMRSDNWQKFCQLHIYEIERLKAENKRLTEDNRQLKKAFEIAEGIIKRMGNAAWNAAKEGKPSV